MRNFLLALVATTALAFPAFAFDASLTSVKAKQGTSAAAQGGASSGSGVLGGSALIGTTNIVTGNASNANGVVQATNGGTQSTVVQAYHTDSTSVLSSNSLGLAGNGGGSIGDATSVGGGKAIQKTKVNSVGLHVGF